MHVSRAYAVTARQICLLLGVPNFLLMTHRSSNDFISPAHYERFAHPSIELITRYLDRHGIVSGLHCDGNWDRNFELMKDLPDSTYFQLDSTSDIFRARRVLGERRLLMGDVSATALAFGTPEEIDSYCERLLRDVGGRGRLILSSGCEVPPNAKPENVRAMIGAASKYGRC